VDLAAVYCEGIRHVSRLDIDFAESSAIASSFWHRPV